MLKTFACVGFFLVIALGVVLYWRESAYINSANNAVISANRFCAEGKKAQKMVEVENARALQSKLLCEGCVFPRLSRPLEDKINSIDEKECTPKGP